LTKHVKMGIYYPTATDWLAEVLQLATSFARWQIQLSSSLPCILGFVAGASIPSKATRVMNQ